VEGCGVAACGDRLCFVGADDVEEWMSVDAAGHPDLIQALQARCGDIAERWYRAVSLTGFTPLDSARVRQRFVEFVGQIVSLLTDGSLESGRAEAIGSAMADLHYIQPETWDRTQEVLRRQLVEGLSSDQIGVVQRRLAACIGKMATGFFWRAREIMLTEQEQIRMALIAERERVEQALEAERALLAQRVAERTAELRAANDELAQVARLKGEFVSNVSHELRTPLSVITLVSGNLDTLYEQLDDDMRRQMIRDIRSYVREMNHIVGNVLEVSRIDGGRVSMKRRRVDLAQLVREEAERHAPLTRQKSHTLSMSGIEPLPVWGNDGQLRQVIRNLLDNAIKYTPDGGQITCECRLWDLERDGGESPGVGWPGADALPGGRWAAFRVVDTGLGISREDQPRVFERFYRVQVPDNVTGTGLGLPIAQELVELHGGRIAIDSTLGQGSNFAVYLPLLEE
jgi:signal transduction histidine kinase